MKKNEQLNVKKMMNNGKNGIHSKKKAKDPVIEPDSKIKLRLYADDLWQRYHDDGMYYHMVFFHSLSDAFRRIGWSNSSNMDLFKSLLDKYNSFMSQHKFIGKDTETIETPFPTIYEDDSFENVFGKYPMFIEEGLPQLLLTVPDTYQQFGEQLIACALLDYIYELADVRKIEARIPELTGLCDYLKTLAPDEYHAYCTLGRQIEYSAPLDIKGYKVFLKLLKIESWSKKN